MTHARATGALLHPPAQSDTPRAASPLRILMVAPTSFFADYGCHVRILEEVMALQVRGHTVQVCTYHHGNTPAGVRVHRSIGFPWLQRTEVGSSRHKAYLDVTLTATTLRRAIAFRPDVIHGHLHEGALIGSVVARLLRKPLILDYQGSLTEEMIDHRFVRTGGSGERFFRAVERGIERLPDTIVPSGAAATTWLRDRYGTTRNIQPLADGVDTCRFDPDQRTAARRSTRERLGIPADATVIGYLGLLASYQGISSILEAAAILRQSRPDLWFVVAGYPAVERYAGMAARLGIADRVLFPGRIPYEDAPDLLSAFDVGLAPKQSTTENNGKLLNYLAMGLPCVATDTITNRAILSDLGHLFPAGDAAGLADAICAALQESPAQRACARQRAMCTFSWATRVLELEAIYADAQRRHGSRRWWKRRAAPTAV